MVENRHHRKRVAGGHPTTDLVFSAHVGENAALLRQILRLHVPRHSTIADVTFGRGTFWKHVPAGDYTLLASDLEARTSRRTNVRSGVDCRTGQRLCPGALCARF